ncbi:hypothetical protein [Kribbella sindirgiensis]|uniref:Uncharacterized protein n=1 Tax=Kribbella sindirgiensis TaxID=1124744 RepID=A0A4R0HXT5_9ACTN|nr:hypothetical protein [Kribbella sindirgiensis]TCC15376.1 hypothetical protein E0H50_42125 [Kribbella sindirgiensis]
MRSPTVAGSQNSGVSYAVFPYVGGRQATGNDTVAIAQAMRAVHDIADLLLPRADLREWCIEALRDRHDHPWLADRRDEVLANVDRLEVVIERARAIDWGHVMLAPREHDLFAALCEPGTVRFLLAYGAEGLDLTHLEYARLARSLRVAGHVRS